MSSKSILSFGALFLSASAAYESFRLLLNDIKSVSIDELLWRIRMRYRPEQTNGLIDKI